MTTPLDIISRALKDIGALEAGEVPSADSAPGTNYWKKKIYLRFDCWEKMKTFTLEDNEAEFVLHVIGQLPTQSGAYPLLQKLQQQYALITEEPPKAE